MTIRNLLLAGGKIAAPVEGDIPANAIPGGGYWTGITCSEDGSKIASCSGNGYVFTSSDFGNTWTLKQNSPAALLTAIASSANAQKLVVQAYEGYLYTSSDFGETYTQITSAGWREWHGVSSSADGTRLVAIDLRGYILKSIDSGVTWTSAPFDYGAGDICMSEDGNTIMVCEFTGARRLLISNNGGNTWDVKTGAGTRAWYCMDCSADGTKIIAGVYGGYMYTSVDSGNTWTERTEWSTGGWAGVRLYNNDSSFLACKYESSIIRVTKNIWG